MLKNKINKRILVVKQKSDFMKLQKQVELELAL